MRLWESNSLAKTRLPGLGGLGAEPVTTQENQINHRGHRVAQGKVIRLPT